jgi:hypothetical protein
VALVENDRQDFRTRLSCNFFHSYVCNISPTKDGPGIFPDLTFYFQEINSGRSTLAFVVQYLMVTQR